MTIAPSSGHGASGHSRQPVSETPETPETPETNGLPFSLGLLADAALGLLGLSLSAYSLRHHLLFKSGTSADAFCNVSDKVSCDAIAASPYSEIMGVPLGVFGIAFFVSLLLFNVMRAASARSGFVGRMASQTHAVMVIIGVVVSLILGSIALMAVKAFCLVCMGIYLVCILLAFSLHYGRAQLVCPF